MHLTRIVIATGWTICIVAAFLAAARADETAVMPPNAVPVRAVGQALLPAVAGTGPGQLAGDRRAADIPEVPAASTVPAAASRTVPPASNVPAAASRTVPPNSNVPPAVRAARRTAEQDIVQMRLGALSAPGWTVDHLQAFVNTASGYGTIRGASLSIPKNQSPALLQEFGCTHALVQQYSRPQRKVQLTVYAFSTPQGAYGAYSMLREGASTVVVRGDASSEDDSSVSIWKGKHFVVIASGSDDDEVSKGLVSSLADQVSVAIHEHADLPGPVVHLPYLGRIAGSERFIMGATAARQVGFPQVQLLQWERSHGAALAGYSFVSPPERLKVLTIAYPNAQSAHEVFLAYIGALAEDHKRISITPLTCLYKMGNSYLACCQRNQQLILVSGAHHKESSLLLISQFGG